MSAIRDTEYDRIVLQGATNETQGARLPLGPIPSNTGRFRLAGRAYWDTFTSSLPSGWSVTAAGHHRLNPTTWDHTYCFGLGFNESFPQMDRGNVGDNDDLDAMWGAANSPLFFGFKTGAGFKASSPELPNDTSSINFYYGQFPGTIGNISWAKPCRGELGSLGDTYRSQRTRFCIRQTTTGTDIQDLHVALNPSLGDVRQYYGGRGSSFLNTTMGFFPANPTDGAKFTFGMEFIALPAPDYRIMYRYYVNTHSLALANLLSVFESPDYILGPFHINLSTADTLDANDAWRQGVGGLPTFPSQLMFRHGFVSQNLILHPVKTSFAALGTF